jgi:hypothetical protein
MNLRRRYVVHQKFQLDFTLKIFAAVFGPVIFCTLFVVLYLKIGGWLAGVQLNPLLDPGFWSVFLLRALPIAFAVFVFSILFSHRIAGPVKRMQNVCEELVKGRKTAQITLRKKDYFHRFAAKLNLLNESCDA